MFEILEHCVAMEHKTFTVAEVAEALRVDPVTIRRWIKAGKIATTPVGSRHRVPQSEFDRLTSPTVSDR